MGRRLAVVQARMGSTRLPGKVLATIAGKPALELMVERLRFIESLDGVVVATTDRPEDRPVAELSERLGCMAFRGSSDDVLDRYYQAARSFDADPVVRFTADCPLIDPEVSQRVIESFQAADFDYVSLAGRFPDGLDTEVISRTALEIAWQEARLPSEREHVTPYVWKNPERFRTGSWEFPGNAWDLRLTVDQPEDLDLVRAICARLYVPGRPFGWRAIMALLDKEPELRLLNSGIPRNEGYLRSLAHDRSEAQ